MTFFGEYLRHTMEQLGVKDYKPLNASEREAGKKAQTAVESGPGQVDESVIPGLLGQDNLKLPLPSAQAAVPAPVAGSQEHTIFSAMGGRGGLE